VSRLFIVEIRSASAFPSWAYRSDSVIFTLITIPGFIKFFFPSKGQVLHHVMLTPVASAKPVIVIGTSLAVTLNVI
jgi:hypothetical protein